MPKTWAMAAPTVLIGGIGWLVGRSASCDNPRTLPEQPLMPHLLYLWREERPVELAAAQIQRLLDTGDDVDGLADLPIKEMIDQLKREFHGAKETAGLLSWKSGEEQFHATWSWQFMRIESDNLLDEHRDKFLDLARHFGCPVYDPQLNLKLA
jgi:hypothetical protein